MKKYPVDGAGARARTLRQNMTEAERRLWQILRSHQMNGCKFRRQVPIGRYIADFVCHEVRLIVEIDGGLTISGTEQMATLHNIREPADLMLAQYSVPFCVAFAVYRDPRNPESFEDGALDDPEIRAAPRPSGRGDPAPTVTVHLADGRRLTRSADDGTLAAGDLGDKFARLTRSALGEPVAAALYERLQRLEEKRTCGGLGLSRSAGWCPSRRASPSANRRQKSRLVPRRWEKIAGFGLQVFNSCYRGRPLRPLGGDDDAAINDLPVQGPTRFSLVVFSPDTTAPTMHARRNNEAQRPGTLEVDDGDPHIVWRDLL